MIERTLVLIKPDGVQRGLVGQIISRFEKTGLKVIALKMTHASKDSAGQHYADDEAWLKSVGEKTLKSYAAKGRAMEETALEIGQRIRQQLIDFITMSPSIAICVEGHAAIEKVRIMVGDTAPLESKPGTIRGDLAFDSYGLADAGGRPLQNLIHASDSVDSARREIGIWFSENEICPYQRVEEALLYRQVK